MKRFWTIWLLFFSMYVFGQDSSTKIKVWELSGYIEDLGWLRSDEEFKHIYATNLVHNRINIKWKPSEKITGRIELRNRLYWGDDINVIPNFKEQLRNQNEALNLSAIWMQSHSTILHTNVERFWVEYRTSKWNVRAGRQRINWGMANTWNPNDIFNSYNFLDFDYQERAGSDALKAQYMVTDLSHVELAFAGTNSQPVSALKYFTNYKKFDLQAIVGLYQNVFTGGVGWAGSISEAGFKGELQLYTGRKDSASHFEGTVEADYMFKKGWYLSSSLLYNEKGLNRPLPKGSTVAFEPSPRGLMPSKWSLLIHSSKELTPILNTGINLIYSPGVHLLIIFPSVGYNVKPNLDLDFVWQSLFAEIETFRAVSHAVFIGAKWSF